MSESVKMPALGESVTEGTVTRWLKNVGDSIEVDEPLLEVSTDKVDTEIPSPIAGVLEKILVEEDETVEVGAELALIGDGSGGSGDESAPQQEDAPEAPAAPAETPAAEAAPAAQPAAENVEAAQPAAEQSTSATEAREEATTSKPSSGGGSGEPITMPALGESVTEGTITRWLKAEGDTVEVDEPLLEVSTDKVDTEIPSPVAGVLTKILVQEDETVEVGAQLAIVGGEAEQAEPEAEPEPEPKDTAQPEPQAQPEPEPQAQPEPTLAPEPQAEPRAEAKPEPVTQSQPQEPPTTGSPRPQEPGSTTEPTTGEHATAGGAYVTPLVRKIAAEKGVDLAAVTGTGIGGRIRKQDVLDAAEKAAQPAPAAAAAPSGAPSAPSTIPEVSPLRGTTEKMSRLRKVIAKRMSESLTTSAQLTTVQEVDVTRIVKLRARTKDEFQRKHGVKLTYLPFFIKAVTDALKGHPKLNATIDGDQIVYHGQENIGIAVDTERGLLVPVIKNAGELDVAGIAKAIVDLADRTRNNKIKPDELSGSTFTVTNIGSAGALFDTPIINQPEVAILGTGSIVKRPVVVADAEGGESIAVRSMVYLPVTYDHRLVDGADAGRFLTAVRKRLEEGAFADELGL